MIDLFLEFMGERFLDGLNLAIQAGWIVLAILVIRILPIRLPRWSVCLLWGLVALRLILPFQIEFDWSLQPSAEPIPVDIAMEPAPKIDSGVEVIDRVVNPVVTESFTPNPATSANPLQILIPLASVAWLLGIAIMLLYSLISSLRLRHRIRASIREGNYYLCDDIQMPFVFGLIRPKIYLPSGLAVETLPHVLRHEECHIKRLDHIWKPLGFLILSVYWFQPLLWVGYLFFCRDLEKACDEAVVGKLDRVSRKAYAEALLSVSMGKIHRLVCPLAFGEEGVKGRIKSVLHYKKPAFWVVLVAILLVIALAVGFLTSPGEHNAKEEAPNEEVVASEGVTLHLVSCELVDGVPTLLVEWENEGEETLEYGTPFSVYKDEEILEAREDLVWTMPLFMVSPGGTQTEKITLWAWDVTEPGEYRVDKKYNLASDRDTSYTASVHFTLTIENGELCINGDGGEVKSQPEPETEQPVSTDFLGYTVLGREKGSWQGVSTRMRVGRVGMASLAYAGTEGEALFAVYLTPMEEATIREIMARYQNDLVEGPAWDPLAVLHWYSWSEGGEKVKLNVGTMKIELIGQDGKYRHTDITMEDWETLHTIAANCYAEPPEGIDPENDKILGYTTVGREMGKYAVVGERMRVSAFFNQESVKHNSIEKFAVFLTPEEEQAVKAVVDRTWDLFTYEYRGNWEKMVNIQFTWSLDPNAEDEYDRSATLLVWPEDRKVELIGMGGNCYHAELPKEEWQVLIDIARACYAGTDADIVKE